VSAPVLIPEAQSQALLHEIERQAKDETGALLAAAEREARALVAEAYARARRRTREAIVELRREGARRLARARAQAETEARRVAQEHATEAIRCARPLLVDALTARWRDPAPRRAWIAAAAHAARTRLRGEAWTVEHPADWSAADEQQVRTAFATDGDVTSAADAALAAGLRIRANDATLDATIDGLLADAPAVAAQFLAELMPAGPDGDAA
jgi:vacuolar-type H+-ATPase subunit H